MPRLSNIPFVLIAIIYLLAGVCCGIAWAGLHDEYASLRDGEHVTGTVSAVEPHATYATVHIDYLRRGTPDSTLAYPPTSEAAQYPVGAKVDLLVSSSGVIRASQLDGKRPPLGLLVGAIVGLLAGLAAIAAQIGLKRPRRAQREPLDPLYDALARTRNVRLAGVFLFVPFAIAFAIVPLLATGSDALTLGQTIMFEALAAASLGVAAWLGAVAFRLRDPCRNPIAELVEKRPEEIAWIHLLEEHGNGLVVLTLMIWKTNGRSETVRVVRDDAHALLEEIARRAPHAARGYSRELERQYRQGNRSGLGSVHS